MYVVECTARFFLKKKLLTLGPITPTGLLGGMIVIFFLSRHNLFPLIGVKAVSKERWDLLGGLDAVNLIN